MKQAFHIIGKDIRDTRLLLPLAGWWSVSILQVLLISTFSRLPSSPPAIEMMSGVFLVGLAWLLAALDLGLLVLIVSQLVQRDSTVGSTAFWLSRPVSGRCLLAGKSLLLLLAVILPTLGVQFLLLLFNGVTLFDAFRSVPQIVVLQVLVLSALMMLAALTRNLQGMLVPGIIAVVGLAIVQYYTFRLFLLRARWDRSLDDSAAIGFVLFLLAIAVTVVCHQYLTRRTKRSLVLASSLVPGLFLFLTLWPWNFWLAEAPVAVAILDPEQVAARVEVDSLRIHRQPHREWEEWLVLSGDLAVDSLARWVWIAIPADISAEQLSASGEVLAHHRRAESPFVSLAGLHDIGPTSTRIWTWSGPNIAGTIAGRGEVPQPGCSILATSVGIVCDPSGTLRPPCRHSGRSTRPRWNLWCNGTGSKPVCGRNWESAMTDGSDHGRILALTGLHVTGHRTKVSASCSASPTTGSPWMPGRPVRYLLVHPTSA